MSPGNPSLEPTGNVSADPDRDAQRYLELVILLSIPCFAWGIWVCWPKIVMEHGRLEPWKVGLQWAGDAAAVFWFVTFVVGRFVLGRPWRGREVTVRAARRFVWVSSASLLAGIAISLAMDFYQDRNERLAFETARPVEGTIVAVSKETVTSEGIVYKLTCRFADEQGRTYTLPIPVFDRVEGGMGPNVSAATAQAVRSGAGPVALTYDPAWPRRFWLREVGYDGAAFAEAGYSGLSKLVLMIQAMEVVLLVLLLHQQILGGLIPWWYRVPAFVPFMVEASLLTVFGPIFRWGRGG